jgi:hypothetical protein
MKKLFVTCLVAVGVLGVAAPAQAIKVADPTPNAMFSDGENQGYVEVASDDGSGNLVRACNENGATPAGDDATGYLWVNPSGEDTPATYGNDVIGAGDEDGEDGSTPTDGDGDTNDDCPPGDHPQ